MSLLESPILAARRRRVERVHIDGGTALDNFDILVALLRLFSLGLGPQAVEDTARMPDSETQDSDNDHRPFEDHEKSLVVGDLATEATCEFDNAIDRANVDQEGCDKKS